MSLFPVVPTRKPCGIQPAPQRSTTVATVTVFTREIAAVSVWGVAGILASIASAPAWADCLPNPPASGQTVTCTGPAPSSVPLDASAASGVTVNVNADAVITGNTNLITLGAGAQLNNLGRIAPVSTGAGNIGVLALGANSTLRNFGTLATSGFNSLSFVSVGNNNVLRNELGGTITISGDLAAGLLASNSDSNSLVNAGQITLNTFQGSGMFVQASDRATLTNTATGVIESNLNEAFGMAAITGTGHTLRNDGSIVTRGQASHGMFLSDTTNSLMTNAGTITTSGGSSETVNRAFGMFVAGGQGNTVQNLAGGVITASGTGSSAMEVFGSTDNLLLNEGSLNVSGTGAHGLYVLSGARNTLENRGTVNTSGQRGNGMRADDGDSTFINSGQLLIGGRDAFGVFMQGNNNSLLNTGTIHATGVNSDGVLSNTTGGGFVARIENTGSIISERSFAVRGVNGQETLINSGLIRSDAGTAIDLRAGNDTLTLRTGSQIIGLADGGTGTDRVILEGAGTASNNFANFETLRMTGADWTWSGSGSFNDTQVESGVLRISGALTSPVTVQAGTQLQIGTGGASGTVTGNITDNGAVVFNRSDNLSYGGVISGSGSVTKIGAGLLTLTANHTYTGNTTVDGGTLSVQGGAINSPTATVTVGSSGNGTLHIENGGRVTGTTSVVGANPGSQGAVLVTGNGSTWTNSSGITIGGAGAGALTVENGGVVQSEFALGASQGGATSTIRVSGSGSRWTTSGFLSLLSGTSTMTIEQAGLVRGGSVVIGENAGAQATAVVSGPGSTLASDSSFEVARSGTGSLTVSNGGTVTSVLGFVGRVAGGVGNALVTGAGSSWINTGPDLTVGNSGTGTLTINEGATVSAPVTFVAYFPGSVGTLNIGGATGNAPAAPGRLDTPAVAMVDGTATINFNHNSSGYEFAPLMRGTGTVNALAGTTILLADNTYTGATTIASPATLQLGNGGTTGSFVGNVANNGTLVFNRADTVTYSGVVSGSGSLIQQGPGLLILPGQHTYSGPTTVQQGTLWVNGSIASATTVAAAGTLGGNGTIFGNVFNSGVVSPGNSIGRLTINGNYAGQGGTLRVESQLGNDASPTDRLVIGGGVASGSTAMQVVNLGGVGALTIGNGIPVVEAVNGGSTAAGAFSLAAPVAAGPYEYVLYRGGVSSGTAENWYLRSTAPSTPVASADMPVPPPTPQAAPNSPVIPVAAAGQPAMPIYRPEVAVHAAVPALAAKLGLTTLGTFHERRGEQWRLNGSGALAAGWGRIFGQSTEQRWAGDVSPEFDGKLWGMQIGTDLYGIDGSDGHRDRFGVFYGHAQASGDVSGAALGQSNTPVGKITLKSNSLGAYWTHFGPSGWYVDGVLMQTWFDGAPRSNRGVGTSTDGNAFSASLEAGLPIALNGGWTLEPQAQLIWQRVSLDSTQDRFSSITYEDTHGVTGRLGVRLQGALQQGKVLWQPWLKANLWRGARGSDAVVFGGVPIATRSDATALELGAGIDIKITKSVGFYATAGYTTDVDGDHRKSLSGNAGLRVAW